MKKALKMMLGLVMMIGLLAGCTTTGSDQGVNAANKDNQNAVENVEASTPKILTYAVGKEPGTLDSNKSVDGMANEILFHISEGLVRNSDGKTEPGIAESWEISQDGLTYTFHLRDSVWSDGVPLTAGDFEYSFKRFLNPATGSSFVETAYGIVNAEAFNKGEITDESEVGIKALDDKTLEIKLNYPISYFPVTLGANAYFYPVRKDIVEKFGAEYAADASKLVTNGPFILENWSHESELRMVKNPNYWNKDKIKLDGITQLIIPDGNTVSSMYDTGELDYNPDISAALAPSYPEAKTALAGTVQMLQFNVEGATPESGKVISNTNFRKALSYALNREDIAAAVAPPGTVAATRFIMPNIPGSNGLFDEEYPLDGIPVSGDEAKAKEYLQKALEELGTTVDQLPVITYVGMEGKNKVYAEAVQDGWSQVLGLKNVEIKILPVPQAIEASMNRQYDVYFQSLSASEDASKILEYWLADGSINWTGWNDETFTKMFNESNVIVNSKERLAKLFEAEKYLMDNGPLEPLLLPGYSYVAKDYVSGVVKSGIGAANQLIYADKTQ